MLLTAIHWLYEKILTVDAYGSNLESYILSHHPQNAGDVERLEREYISKFTKGYLK